MRIDKCCHFRKYSWFSQYVDIDGPPSVASLPFGGKYRLIDFPFKPLLMVFVVSLSIFQRDNISSVFDHDCVQDAVENISPS